MHQKGIWYEMYVGNVTQNIRGAVHNVSDNDCEEVRTELMCQCRLFLRGVRTCMLEQYFMLELRPDILPVP